jgi:hypothetical protein
MLWMSSPLSLVTLSDVFCTVVKSCFVVTKTALLFLPTKVFPQIVGGRCALAFGTL